MALTRAVQKPAWSGLIQAVVPPVVQPAVGHSLVWSHSGCSPDCCTGCGGSYPAWSHLIQAVVPPVVLATVG